MTAKGNLFHKNGFVPPFHRLQVLTWILFGVFALSFYILFLFAFSNVIIFTIILFLYSIELLAVVWSATKCTLADPSDTFDPNNVEHTDSKAWCPFCDAVVFKSSKHCRACDKCVEGFDHHCIFINNCVGRANYLLFLYSIISASILCITQFCIGMIIFVDLLSNDSLHYIQVCSVFGNSLPLLFLQIVFPVILTLLFVCGSLIIQLLLFHIRLLYRGVTTYDWILERRSKTEAKAAEKLAMRRTFSAARTRVAFDGPSLCCPSSSDDKKQEIHVEKAPEISFATLDNV